MTDPSTGDRTESGGSDRLGGMPRAFWFLGALALAVMLALTFLYVLSRVSMYFFARSYVDEISDVFDLDKNLSRAVVWGTFALVAFFASLVFSLSKTKRRLGLVGLLLLVIAHTLVLWRGSSVALVDRSGAPTKCYVITANDVKYGHRSGIDPETGKECRPISAAIAQRLVEYKKGKRPRRLDEVGDDEFFDPRSGEARVWAFLGSGGAVELYDLMGFHPESGVELVPVTPDLVKRFKEQRRVATAEAPKRVDLARISPFDPVTGTARVWFWRDANGEFYFFDRPGFSPSTGEALKLITHDALKLWREQKSAQSSHKCYLLTREGISYGATPGRDSQTGATCRELTPEVARLAREYADGRRPKRLDVPDPVFFDLRTGEAIVWHHRDKSGGIELFDLMGFHPTSGAELSPVTADIVAAWKAQHRSGTNATRSPPKRVDLAEHAPFDSLTGEARVWFWVSPQGIYEFYDNPGFHPIMGDALRPFTREEGLKYQELLLKRKAEDDKRKAELEAQQKAKREEEAKQEEQRQKTATTAAEVGERCDAMAANPTDSRRNQLITGVRFSELKATSEEAARICRTAAEHHPDQLRYQYQWARALGLTDPAAAAEIFSKLVQAGYPAAHDNLGWIHFYRRDFRTAVRLFRRGIALGDADCMVSLVEMYDRGHTEPLTDQEEKVALLSRASELGHQGATEALALEREKTEQNEVSARQTEDALRVMGRFLQLIPRR